MAGLHASTAELPCGLAIISADRAYASDIAAVYPDAISVFINPTDGVQFPDRFWSLDTTFFENKGVCVVDPGSGSDTISQVESSMRGRWLARTGHGRIVRAIIDQANQTFEDVSFVRYTTENVRVYGFSSELTESVSRRLSVLWSRIAR